MPDPRMNNGVGSRQPSRCDDPALDQSIHSHRRTRQRSREIFTHPRLLHERHSQHGRVLRREDKRQPAVFGMVHLENTAVFGGCHVHPPWRGEDGGIGALWPTIVNIVVWHSILRYSLTNHASELRPRRFGPLRGWHRLVSRRQTVPGARAGLVIAPPAGAWSGARCRANGSFIRAGIPVSFSSFLCPGLRRTLPLALIEIERRIQFGLAGQEFPEPRFVLESFTRLFLEIPQHLLSAGRAVLFVRHGLVEA